MPSERDIQHGLLVIDELAAGHAAYVVYGAGKFTGHLLEQAQAADLPMPRAILDDQSPRQTLSGVPVVHPQELQALDTTAVILGTDTFQQSMREQLQQRFPSCHGQVIDLQQPANSTGSMDRRLPDNIYHCCGHKTASRWITGMLSDPLVLEQTGLRHMDYERERYDGFDPRPVMERTFSEPFPLRTIVSPMYIPFPGFKSIPKPESYRAFYITRDPRDMLTSLYFSMRYSHPAQGEIPALRQRLCELNREEGINLLIATWKRNRYYENIASWAQAGKADDRIQRFRFEDLTGPRRPIAVRNLLHHCGIGLSDSQLLTLLERHAFQRLAGRAAGTENIQSHYRKGIAGDWQNHFTEKNIAYFNQVTDDLVHVLGYTS